MAGTLCIALSACDLPALDFDKDAPGEKTAEAPPPPSVTNPYATLSGFEPYPNAPTGALGLNVKSYLAQGPQTLEARVTRLENALSAIQKDLAQIAPVIQKLAVIPPSVNTVPLLPPDDMMQGKTMSPSTTSAATAPPQQLGTNTGQPVKPAVPPKAQALQAPPAQPKGQPTSQSASTPVAPAKKLNTNKVDTSGPATVKRLRLGEHSNKTRMVLDITKEATYSYDIDTMEDLLIIELPDTQWDARRTWEASDHPLISSYSATDFNGGTRLIVGLKNDARVIKELTIEPGKSPYHRLVLDFAQ